MIKSPKRDRYPVDEFTTIRKSNIEPFVASVLASQKINGNPITDNYPSLGVTSSKDLSTSSQNTHYKTKRDFLKDKNILADLIGKKTVKNAIENG